ncbi:MAG TPA: hypothetical protein DD417_08100 [Elusimicrobia bacterium]|nr:hypothetical protein [Elusimicrobiota bacterium]
MMKLAALRKHIAKVLTVTLLLTQQGPFVSEALASAIISVPQTGTPVGPGVGAAGSAVGSLSPVTLNGLEVRSPGLGRLSATLPGVSNLQPAVSPSLISGTVLQAGRSLPNTVSQNPAVTPTAVSPVLPASTIRGAARRSHPETPLSPAQRAIPEVGPGQKISGIGDDQPLSGAQVDTEHAEKVLKTVERFALSSAEQGLASLEAKAADEPDLGWDSIPAVPKEAPRTVAEASLEVPADAKFTPSPKNWEGEIIYSVMLDRFGRSKDHKSWGDPKLATTRHGGNIKGLLERLDYIQGLGVTTLLVNPLYMSLPAAYHNYWPIHFMAVDPSLGTMADFQQLVSEAHKRGMRIVLDVVFNHIGPLIEYEGGWKFGPSPKKIKGWKYGLQPTELKDENHYHRRGSIDDWHNEEQMKYGDFPGGLNHLATERPATQDILLKIAKWWMKETDVDGFRLDTYPHVAPSFWTRFFKEIREYGAKLGKDNFLILGEIYHGDPNAIKPELGSGRLDAAFNYPNYFTDNDALHGKGPTRWLENGFNFVRGAMGGMMKRLVRFMDNQDKPRFLNDGQPLGVAKVALAFTLFSMGIPFIFYGTEQAFRQMPGMEKLGMDGFREDMFPGGKFKPSGKDDNFDTQAPLYQAVRAFAEARKAHPALSLGDQFIRWSDPNGPGIFAFSRIHEGKEVVVVMNTSGEARNAEMWVDGGLTPAGTGLSDALDAGYAIKAHAAQGGGAKVFVEVPAHGVRVLVRAAK